jgi:NTP pyrophosphatase (non-canonical NTP hydrolase)
LQKLTSEAIAFRDERNWHKYHTPENLAKSICIEAAELLECFQWGDESDTGDPVEECCDVMIYLLTLGHELEIDWEKEVRRKIKRNGEKYPIDRPGT